jgi:putative ATPase
MPGNALAPGQLLRRAIEADRIQSLIYGPPGRGKHQLAQIIAHTPEQIQRSAAATDMRRVHSIGRESARQHRAAGVLFIDEIHRFKPSGRAVARCGGGVVPIGDTIRSSSSIRRWFPFADFRLQPLTEDGCSRLRRRGDSGAVLALRVPALEHLRASLLACAQSLNSLEIAALTTAPGESGSLSRWRSRSRAFQRSHCLHGVAMRTTTRFRRSSSRCAL